MNNLNPTQKLNPKIFKIDVERVSLRQGFGEGLLEAARADKRVVALCADLLNSTRLDLFQKEFPERLVEVGIAEQNLVGVAAGMAVLGKVPFAVSYAIFSPGRNWEQIRTMICYNDTNVKIVGSHAGVSVGPDGGSHQALEDIALMRVLPRMTVVAPADSLEAKEATRALAKWVGPAYLRLSREATPIMTTDESPFMIGKANVWRRPEKTKVAIIGCGPILYQAMEAAKELAEEGIEVSVTNLHTIKPLDGQTIAELAQEAGAVVTVEEHQRQGGMGSAVAEFLAEHYPVPLEFVGVDNQFGQSGRPEELLRHYGLGVGTIKMAVQHVLQRKLGIKVGNICN
jgi:transketolase